MSIPYSPSNLGTSNGKSPLMFGAMDGGNERALARKYLSKAFGNMKNSGLNSSPLLYNKNILGPFRTAFNGGDVITNNIEDTNKIYGTESNQVGGNNLSRLQRRGDGKSGQNGNAMYSGNTKFVHAGSDYIRFKKLQALNKTYNDQGYGGAENSQHQIAIYRIRK
jgi:hypothetical protein